jgi:PIN domain nuclease of toxin-antitoxin system
VETDVGHRSGRFSRGTQLREDVRLLLDTVILIYAVESPERLSKRAASALKNPGNILELSVISLAEMAIKASLGKLRLSAPVVQQAVEDLGIRVLPYTADHAFHLFDLPRHHGDPFDRQIIAQALSEEIPVVSSDEKFYLYKGLKLIW